MNDDDDALFRQQLSDVRPLKISPRVGLKRGEQSALAQRERRRAAQQSLSRDNNHLSSAELPLLDAHYPLSFKRGGIQHGVFRKLKQGRYQADARLDLHRMVLERARCEVFDFIRQSRAYDLRCVLIVHGKGQHSGAASALLKTYVNHWLQDMAEVQAFCSARPEHGGVGAVYVLLAKSDRAKQQNREFFARGRRDAPP